jgi:mannose PTS system EIIA component
MTVGLLLITHNRVGAELLGTASATLGICPLATAVLPVMPDSDPEALVTRGRHMVAELDQGHGVLVLTDVYGSTPSNIATRVAEHDGRAMVVAGINLPMLLRILNYPQLDLQDLAEKALSGGRDGILLCQDECGN